MKMLDNLRDRGTTTNGNAPAHVTSAPEGDLAPEADLAIADYDSLDAKELTAVLAPRSQVELTAIEDHERANQARASVLDKLRYLREQEPVPGYDALSTEQVLTQLETADLPTAKDVREYERRHQDRRQILDAIVVVIRDRLGSAATAG
jgi:hypothetical protein